MTAIPASFWRSVGVDEFRKIVREQDGHLNAEQCVRLWRLTDRQGEPPQSLQVRVRPEDVMRAFPR